MLHSFTLSLILKETLSNTMIIHIMLTISWIESRLFGKIRELQFIMGVFSSYSNVMVFTNSKA